MGNKHDRSPWVKALGRGLMAAACLIASGCTSLSRRQPVKPFTIIVLPDTQVYALHYPDTFTGQLNWIKGQQEERNIVCVIHEGDITHLCTEPEWEVADQAMSIIDGLVPYCMVMGNHDYEQGKPSQRNSAQFNKHFGSQRFGKEPWYGGNFGEGNENAFYRIHVEGADFIVLCLEFGPRDEVLEWANQVVSQNKDHKVIVVTHSYTYSDDTRVGTGDKWNPHGYGCSNDGDDMWDKFVKKHENIFLVLSGHILNDGLGRLTSVGDKGNEVHQILANYQMKPNGGDGWLRIMKFIPEEKKIAVTTYSPLLKQYAEDAANQFEVEYE
ncbi:MAG: metallophosphoesterase [Kiritimatiellales bacterium]|nr:metallophosphoesterase [Kiritimatiellales bacterium]